MANKNSNAELKGMLRTIEHLIDQSDAALNRVSPFKKKVQDLTMDGTVNSDATMD